MCRCVSIIPGMTRPPRRTTGRPPEPFGVIAGLLAVVRTPVRCSVSGTLGAPARTCQGRDREEGAVPREGAGPDFIEALARGLDVIAAFRPARQALTLAEVAAATGLARPTARRILLTLQ